MVDNKILIQRVFICHCTENWLSSVVLIMTKVVEVLVSQLHVFVTRPLFVGWGRATDALGNREWAIIIVSDLNRLHIWVGDDLTGGLLRHFLVQQMCELFLQLWILHWLKTGALNFLGKIRFIRCKALLQRSCDISFQLAGVDYLVRVSPWHIRQ